MNEEELSRIISECLDMFDDNLEILNHIQFKLDEEKEDTLKPDMQLHDLIDMSEDVHLSSKIKRAEENFMKRRA